MVWSVLSCLHHCGEPAPTVLLPFLLPAGAVPCVNPGLLPLLCFSGQNWGLVCAHRLQHSDVEESRVGSAMGHPPMCTRGTHWGETLVKPKTALIPSGSLSAPNLMSSQPFRNRHFAEPFGAPLGVLLGCGPAQVDCSSEGCSRLQQPLPPCVGLTPVLISACSERAVSAPVHSISHEASGAWGRCLEGWKYATFHISCSPKGSGLRH